MPETPRDPPPRPGARSSARLTGRAAGPLDPSTAGWLVRLVEAFLDVHDRGASERAVMQVIAEQPDAPREELAARLADRRLRGIGLRPGGPALAPALEARLAPLLPPPGPARDHVVGTVAVLAAQWEVLDDIALLYENRSQREERALEAFTVSALLLNDVALARRLHQAHLEAAGGKAIDLAPWAAEVEKLLMVRGAKRGRGVPISGLTYLDTRAFALLAAHYFERASVEEAGVQKLHALTNSQKIGLVELLIALAWADGRLAAEERRMIDQQIGLADLSPADKRRLEALLERRPSLEELELGPTSPDARRFFLEQGVLLTLVDDDLSPAEQALLEEVARRLGGTSEELEATILEVVAFYEKNRDAIRDFGPVSGAFGRLRTLVADRAQRAVMSNLRKLVTEVKETGELAKLLGMASLRELTPEEMGKVKSQLLDICKTIPALAIFVLPGGAILLPILLKVLPFSLLPTAFNDDAAR